ncbi:P-loop containing nucleoside triphosphate hydrolase [Parasponia andersonii]|uniref:P-loop containing nucleoside triphosphate hydrolase n=1 Tax=Parasponia andersonii TaxID=3476 RepID=A0A2P5BQG3_PARAD|nr:P-loop containing nucleoside triphosphate hydrolase [Parasponia andersonii]
MKKEKGVAVSCHDEDDDDNNCNSNEEEDNNNSNILIHGDKKDTSFPSSVVRFSSRNTSSKYDFVKGKPKVYEMGNYSVLRYFDISCVRFHHQRVPLVILVCGTACVGKSTIATQLAQRLNLPNVLQTDMVYELLRTSTDAPLASTPVWARDFSSSEELITEFCRECRIVRKGLAGDLKKAMKDGKPIIIEGIHLDPSIYLMDDDSKLASSIQEKVKQASSESVASDDTKTQVENNSLSVSGSHDEFGKCELHVNSQEDFSVNEVKKVSDHLEAIYIAGNAHENKGDPLKDPGVEKNTPVKKEKSGAEPIIVPLVLKMAEFDHKALLEEWISTRTFRDTSLVQDKDKLITNLKTIQDYLCSFKSQGLTVVNVSATTFPQTLDWLHGYLLQVDINSIIGVLKAAAKAEN